MPEKSKIHIKILLHVIDILYEQEYLREEERTFMKSQILLKQSQKDGKISGEGSNL